LGKKKMGKEEKHQTQLTRVTSALNLRKPGIIKNRAPQKSTKAQGKNTRAPRESKVKKRKRGN